MHEKPDGFTSALRVFHQAAEKVPAYRDFLIRHHIDPGRILSYVDFRDVPPVTKQNYLKQYPVKDLQWNGSCQGARIVSLSSGSSGVPFYWFRGDQAQHDSVELHDRLFTDSFHTKEQDTLVIIAFAMGTWIAGTYTYSALLELATRGHRIVTITPGINKSETIHILKHLAPEFQQVILAAYPPLAKDILDEAAYQGLDLPALNISLLFAGEGFSENWRDYVLNLIDRPDDYYRTAAIYGTADAGCMGHESPLSQFIRRQAATHPALACRLFGGAQVLPTLVHYQPALRFFETDGEHLLFTVHNSIPLIRYKILDRGHLISPDDMTRCLKAEGVTLPTGLQEFNDRPYICLFSRTDVAATFYAVNIYPENIKAGLEIDRLTDSITGKFVLKTEYTEDQEQLLVLEIELKQDVGEDPRLARTIQVHVMDSVRRLNAEFHRLYQELQDRAVPRIDLYPYGSSQFEVKGKHRWTAPSIVP